MTATSWVQIIKAVLLMIGTVIISFLVLWKFNFNILGMFSEMKTATAHGEDYLHPGIKYTNGIRYIINDDCISIRYCWSYHIF